MNHSTTHTEIIFNNLAIHSPWPKRLLSLEDFPVKRKTETEVLREFQEEKWAQLLELVKNSSDKHIDSYEALGNDCEEIVPYFNNNKFFLTQYPTILNDHINLYSEIISPFLENASALVELGAGYGSKIMGLANLPAFSNIPLIAAEYTENGRKLIELLNEDKRKQLKVGYCDFRKLIIDENLVPENSVIFTSSSVHYIPELEMEFADFLLKLKPKVVIHFEPIYELLSSNSIYELMCQRYMQLNDYTRNLLSVINNSVNKKESVITSIKANCLGANPFLPISVLVWQPVR